MAKFQLSLASTYVPSWGIWEAAREVIQNALDAQDEGHEMTVRHQGTTLRVHTTGVKLDKNVWLTGETSKASNENARGHFGEGLQLAMLALVRANHKVVIINDDESWTPCLEASEIFNRDVLTVYTRTGRTPTGKFSVEIEGITKEVWEEIKPRFLALVEPKKVEDTSRARLILDPDMKGKVFVKGIWVETIPTLNAGYDLKFAQTDRDRRMVNAWDLKWATSEAWNEVATRNPVMITEQIVPMMMASAPDMEQMSYQASTPMREAFKTEFQKVHGENAIAVASMAEAKEAGHLGKRGVVTPKGVVEMLAPVQGDLVKLRTEFKRSVLRTYSPHELSELETANWNTVAALVDSVSTGYAAVESRATIVDFADAATEGTYQGGAIQIARRMLSNFDDLLIVIVHEVAHESGSDGAVQHENAQMKIMARIVSKLRLLN